MISYEIESFPRQFWEGGFELNMECADKPQFDHLSFRGPFLISQIPQESWNPDTLDTLLVSCPGYVLD